MAQFRLIMASWTSIIPPLIRIKRHLVALNIKEVRAKLPNSSSGHPQGARDRTLRQPTPQLRVKTRLTPSLTLVAPKLLISLVAAMKIREKETNQMIILFRRAINQISKRLAWTSSTLCHLIKDRNQSLIKLQTPANFSQRAVTQAIQLRPSLKMGRESKVNHRREIQLRPLDRIHSKSNR